MSYEHYLDKVIGNLGDDACPICVDSFLDISDASNPDHPGLAVLPCGHAYHDVCLTKWIDQTNTCPVCRTKFNIYQTVDKVGGESPFC